MYDALNVHAATRSPFTATGGATSEYPSNTPAPMEQTTKATIYGLISNLEKYTIEDAKRILFQMAQDMDRAYDTQVRDLRRKAEVFDQLDAYGCNSAGAWLDIVDENRRLKESAAPQVGGEGIGEAVQKFAHDFCGKWANTFSSHDSVAVVIELREAIEKLLRSHGLFSPADQLVKAGEAMAKDIRLLAHQAQRPQCPHCGHLIGSNGEQDHSPHCVVPNLLFHVDNWSAARSQTPTNDGK